MKKPLEKICRVAAGAALAVGLAANAVAAEMTVSAAASLTDAFGEMKTLFEKAHPGLHVNTNFAASNPLLKQLEEGAPADVFASADQQTMDKAVAAKVVDPATRRNFAVNDLVLIVPRGAKKPANLADLKAMKRIAIGNPDSVPAGRYARDALAAAGLWEALLPECVQAASVRQALAYVARGEADAGFVYRTDALQMGDKVEIALVVGDHEPVLYPIAVATTGANPKAGQEFIDFVLSPEGQRVLARYGFSRP
ncbi:molybdate ABC transporter substrate-binding protein [Desulfovibrio sp.]|uniref:molybdate ABC transporter substrate-binding protein n=1 Tax=Desulfovibrio sp. TaxID=885 RepID=UPI0023C71D99|nr:molybdate ABC transporter substrate-binding protein [Desulfovibrio sp.]MDE7240699.1 molybdate ABC transporter substrate-binding protein [Desulfovibrio sp.]